MPKKSNKERMAALKISSPEGKVKFKGTWYPSQTAADTAKRKYLAKHQEKVTDREREGLPSVTKTVAYKRKK